MVLDLDAITYQTIQIIIDGLKTILFSPGMMALYKGFLVSAVVAGAIALVVAGISKKYYLLLGYPRKTAMRKAKRNADLAGAIVNLWDVWEHRKK